MYLSVNCVKFTSAGKCRHPSAPKGILGPKRCILIDNPDCRVKKCALMLPAELPRPWPGLPTAQPVRNFGPPPSPRARAQFDQAQSIIQLLETLQADRSESFRHQVSKAVREMAEDLVKLGSPVDEGGK